MARELATESRFAKGIRFAENESRDKGKGVKVLGDEVGKVLVTTGFIAQMFWIIKGSTTLTTPALLSQKTGRGGGRQGAAG